MKRFLLTGILVSSIFFTLSENVNAAPKVMPDGTTFDAEFYANTYPDVKSAVGNDEAALYNHYVQHGKAEGRKATATSTTPASTTYQDNFDPVFYANTYPDLKAAFGNDAKALYNHYITCGKAEGRKGCASSVATTVTNSSVPVKTPPIVEKMATALANYDFRALSSYAESYDSYNKDIEPFMVKQKDSNGLSAKYYQLPSSIGNITLGFGEDADYGITIIIGITRNDSAVGEASAADFYRSQLLTVEHYAKFGISKPMPEKHTYGVDMFIAGDEWISYNCAKYINNYKYTEVYANGWKYDSIAHYEANDPWVRSGYFGF